jgi:hypothetical protein
MILLPQPSKYCGYRYVPLCLVYLFISLKEILLFEYFKII